MLAPQLPPQWRKCCSGEICQPMLVSGRRLVMMACREGMHTATWTYALVNVVPRCAKLSICGVCMCSNPSAAAKERVERV